MQDIAEIPDLKPQYKAFTIEYLKNGFNATQAYIKTFPDTSISSAYSNACRILRLDGVKRLIDKELQRRVQIESRTTGLTKDTIVRKSYDMVLKSEELMDYGTALKGLDQTARLLGYYEREEGSNQFEQIINAFQIKDSNVNITVHNNATTVDTDATEEPVSHETIDAEISDETDEPGPDTRR